MMPSYFSWFGKSPVPAVEGSIIDFCLRNTLGDAGSLDSGGAGDEGADDAVIVAILVVRENVALLPTRLRQLQLCAVALNTSQRVVLAENGNIRNIVAELR